MRFLLIVWTLLGALLVCSADAFSAEGQPTLVSRWELRSMGVPITQRRPAYIVIESTTIRVKEDCNEVTIGYTIDGNELRATSMTSTLVACSPVGRNADADRAIYQAALHSRYQVDGDTLRLFSLKESAVDYKLEFHRVR